MTATKEFTQIDKPIVGITVTAVAAIFLVGAIFTRRFVKRAPAWRRSKVQKAPFAIDHDLKPAYD